MLLLSLLPRFYLKILSLNRLALVTSSNTRHIFNNPIAQRIHTLLNSLTASSITVCFFWIPGPIGLPEHDAVDIATKKSLVSLTITDSSLTPAYDLKIYYHSMIFSSWHKLWNLQFTKKFEEHSLIFFQSNFSQRSTRTP